MTFQLAECDFGMPELRQGGLMSNRWATNPLHRTSPRVCSLGLLRTGRFQRPALKFKSDPFNPPPETVVLADTLAASRFPHRRALVFRAMEWRFTRRHCPDLLTIDVLDGA
jgi:hypothetical protein